MNPFLALMRRDMLLAFRSGGGALMGALFFLIVVAIVPFAVGPDLALLALIGPAILWLGALLASLLALDRLFTADYEDGSLDLLMTGSLPLELAVTAKALAMASDKPLIAVNHLEGHALSPRLADPALEFPYALLLVSGGHCQILRVAGVGQYQRLATTIDDALGEAFDKTAKILGLGYPGGPAVERLAREGRTELARQCFDFLPSRSALDLAGWEETDIFAHS